MSETVALPSHSIYVYGDGTGSVRVELESRAGDTCWALVWGGTSGANWKAARFLLNPLRHEPLPDEANGQAQGRFRRVDDLIAGLTPWLEAELGSVLDAMVAAAVLRPLLKRCEVLGFAKQSGRAWLAEEFGVGVFVEMLAFDQSRFWDRV